MADPSALQYDDFTLQIESDGQGGLRVRGRGLARGHQAPFQWPFSRRRVERRMTALEAAVWRSGRHGRPAVRQRQTARIEKIGEALFEALLGGGLKEALARCRPIHRGQDARPLRLRLVFDLKDPAVAEVAGLPWELLRDPQFDFFLARRSNIPVVRCLEVPHRGAPPLRQGPLRVLLVAAQPKSLPPLDLEKEARWIAEALGKGGTIHTLPNATAEALREAVRSQRIDVLHLMGHGGFEEHTGHGVLCLENQQGGTAPLTGRALADLVHDASCLRLVFLNACDTAQFDRRQGWNPYSGVASALVQGGIPEVVAMQFPISDGAAQAFSRAFYQQVAQGAAPEAAVAEGRLAILAREESLEWATPVLFSSLSAREDSALHRLPRRSRRGLFAALGLGAAIVALAGYLALSPSGSSEAPGILGFVGSHGTADIYSLPEVPEVAECPSPPGLDLDLVPIPRGRFWMGSDTGSKDARPAHEVIFGEGFCIGALEVTRGLWRMVMEDAAPDELGEDRFLPQQEISWSDARKFINGLNTLAKARVFSLPTEQEWEYAARAGTTTAYSFGEDAVDLPLYGNCTAGDDFDGLPAPVGSFAPNPWGLYDIHGNVWEWTADLYAPYLLGDWIPDDEGKRVRRGGSFGNKAETCSTASRSGVKPERREQVNGLRIVRRREADPPSP
jgi:formylglycine-generating enzyme required for sulfatase activity